jgi:hypothetical protein
MSTSWQSRLKFVNDLSSLIHKFAQKSSVPPSYIIFIDFSHKLSPQLTSGQRSVDKCSGFFLVEIKLFLSSFDLIIIIEEGFST